MLIYFRHRIREKYNVKLCKAKYNGQDSVNLDIIVLKLRHGDVPWDKLFETIFSKRDVFAFLYVFVNSVTGKTVTN